MVLFTGSPRLLLASCVVSWAVLCGCGTEPPSPPAPDAAATERVGGISLKLSVGDRTLATASYVITGPRGFVKTGDIDVSRSAKISLVVGGLPTGSRYSIVLSGTTTDGSTSCGGSGSFAIEAGKTTRLTLAITCHEAPGAGSVTVVGTLNTCPAVDALSALPSSAVLGATLSVEAAAHDRDAGPSALSYDWATNSGVLTGSRPTSRKLICTVAGPATVTVTVRDGDPNCHASESVTVDCATEGPSACIPGGGFCSSGHQCCSHRCDQLQGPAPGTGKCGDETLLGGPLATLPAAIKRKDFRLSPPPVLRVEASAAVDGSTDVGVVFGPDSRLDSLKQLALPVDQGEMVLTAAPNAKVDGIESHRFTTNVPVAFRDVAAGQAQIYQRAIQLGEREVAEFRGRELVSSSARFEPVGDTLVLQPSPVALIDAKRTLTVSDPSVTGDPARTFDPCTDVGTPLGAWTFGKLMTDMAGTKDPGDFVESWLTSFLSDQDVNHFTVKAQPTIGVPGQKLADLLEAWPRTARSSLDLSKSPFRLLAIVNRIDLAANNSYGAGGGAEGRFIFRMVQKSGSDCHLLPFFVIFEYGVPRSQCSDVRDWAQQWLMLGTVPLGSPAYNTMLQAITDQFASASANPSQPNGSALNQLRTNHHITNGVVEEIWELREFHLYRDGGTDALLHTVATAQTPDSQYNTSKFGASTTPGPRAPQLAEWLLENVSPAANPQQAPTYTVPLALPCPLGSSGLDCSGFAFRGGSSINFFDFWTADGPTNQALNVFSLNTCNGCHGLETQTTFVHVNSGNDFSGFLTGITVSDPRDPPLKHTYNDLLRRKRVLNSLAGAFCGKVGEPPPAELAFPSPLPPIEMVPVLAVH